jgi:integrase
VKHGSVSQRHTRVCPRSTDGSFKPHRCRGSWQWVLEYGRDSNGRRLQTSKAGFPTKAAAQSALQEAVHVFMVDVSVSNTTVGEYLKTWLQAKHSLKPTTVSLYADLTRNYLVPHLGDVRLLDLRAHHLDRMYQATSLGKSGRPLSTTTIRRIHGVLRSALNTAVKRRLIPYNPANHIELAPENHRRAKPWTAEQCQEFLARTADDRLMDLYWLMIVTGMRRGETVGLRWEDVDLNDECFVVIQQITDVNGRSVVSTPKTKRGQRLVQLDPDTVTMLRRHKEAQDLERSAWGPAWNDAGLVFTREDGRALRPEYATRHFQDLVKQVGLPPIRLHDLRHTSASLALAAGVDLKVVSERLGHSQLAITADLYTHVNRRLGKAAAQRIADVLRPSAETVPSAFLAQAPGSRPQSGGETRDCPSPGTPSSGISAGHRPK